MLFVCLNVHSDTSTYASYKHAYNVLFLYTFCFVFFVFVLSIYFYLRSTRTHTYTITHPSTAYAHLIQVVTISLLRIVARNNNNNNNSHKKCNAQAHYAHFLLFPNMPCRHRATRPRPLSPQNLRWIYRPGEIYLWTN